jgi:hypothetical protein
VRKALAWVGLVALLALPAFALAQEAQEDPLEDRAETFEAAEAGAQTENIPGGMLMIVAYNLSWVFVLGYVVSLGFRQARTARDLERLREELAARPSDEG